MRSTMSRRLRIVALTALLGTSVSLVAAQAPPLKPDRKMIERVAAALKESKLRYEKNADATWTVTVGNPVGPHQEVVVHAALAMVMVTVDLGTLPLEPETMKALLSASYNANFAKVALDEDGHVVAMTEVSPDFSASALKRAIEEVAGLAEETMSLAVAPATKVASETFPDVPAGTGATLTLARGTFEVSYDPKKWREQKTGDINIFQLQHVTGDAYARLIAERMAVAVEEFSEVILENARSAATDIVLESKTSRTINTLPVTILRYSGTARGVTFTFLNQAYSDQSGSAQIACWTGKTLLDEYKRDFLELFAGFRKR